METVILIQVAATIASGLMPLRSGTAHDAIDDSQMDLIASAAVRLALKIEKAALAPRDG